MQQLEESHEINDFALVNLGEPIELSHYDNNTINRKNGGWTLLMYACNGGLLDLVRELIARGAKPSERSDDGKTALMIAVSAGQLPIALRVLVEDQLEVADFRGWTALFHSVFYGREECVKFLIRKGANVNAMDKSGQTPLSVAVKGGMDSIVSVILGRQNEHKPAINIKHEVTNDPSNESRTPTKGFFNDLLKSKRTFTPNCKRPLPVDKKDIIPTPNKKKSIAVPQVQSPWSLQYLAQTPIQYLTPVKNDCLRAGDEQSTPSVLEFLEELQLEKYWPIFRDEEVDFETLMTFDADNLKEIGISRYGPQRKIAMAIQEYKTVHSKNSKLLKNPSWGRT